MLTVTVEALSREIVSIATGGEHSCIVMNGDVWCWGGNSLGQLGLGTTADQATPQKVSVLPGVFKEVAAGQQHTCALTVEGAVWCWGNNVHGAVCGDCTVMSTGPGLKAFRVPGLESNVSHIFANGLRSAALRDGNLLQWGRNTGNKESNGGALPVKDAFLTELLGTPNKFIRIGLAGDEHSPDTCVTNSAGESSCWGESVGGKKMSGPKASAQVAMDASLSCALGRDGNLSCEDKTKNVFKITKAVDFAITSKMYSDGASVCALTQNSDVICNQLVKGKFGASTPLVRADGSALKKVSKIASNHGHSCAIAEEKVYCWGQNNRGQLGLQSPNFQKFSSPVKAMRTGNASSCALLASGQVNCWGNGFGVSPKPLDGGPATRFDVGNEYSCLAGDAGVVCNGPGFYTYSFASNSISELAVGDRRACAVDRAGLWCWGDFAAEEHNVKLSRERVLGIKGKAKKVSIGETGTCALADNKVWCWSVYGAEMVPKVQKLSGNAIDVSIGELMACAVLENGKVECLAKKPQSIPQHGSNATFEISETQEVRLPEKAVSVAVGLGNSGCILAESKKVYCWDETTFRPRPTTDALLVETPGPVRSLDYKYSNGCALLESGDFHCWGKYNTFGELGWGRPSEVALEVPLK